MLDRTIPPPIQKISSLNLQHAETRYLANGIPLHIINAGKHDIIKTEFIFKSGKWYEDTSGISNFASKMLLEGTSARNSQQISEYFESFGAQVQINPGSDFISISLYVLQKYLKDVLAMVKECLLESIFPEEELKILRDIQIEQIRVNEKKNSYLAARDFRKLLFPEKHPYGTYLRTEDISITINRDTILDYYNNKLLKGIEIMLSGQIGEKTIRFFDIFSDLGFRKPEKRNFKADNESDNFRSSDIEGSIQTSVRIGKRAIPKSHPDHHGLVVLNEILGGYFGSRLMKNIREDKGFTYGIYSALVHYINDGFWVIGSDVHKESNEEAIEEIFRELKRLREEPVGPEELTTVKNYMLGSFLNSLETSFALAGKFKKIHFFDLGYEFYDNYIKTINSIDSQTLQNLAVKYLDKDSFYVVKVG